MERIYAKGKCLVDEYGRERIFSGVNAVDKSDYSEGVQKYPSLDEGVIKKFAEAGFNLLRLGFTWAKIEPQPGKYNDEYIDSVSEIIDLCEKYNIYVFLDMHQDLFSPVTNGDGAPKWATLLDGIKVKPTRFVWAEGYFWGKACHRAFDNFWSNKQVNGKGLQDWFADCWSYVVERLGDKTPVIGFDMLNEPFPGKSGGKCFRKIVTGATKTILFSKNVKRGKLIKDVLSKDRVEKVLNHITFPVLHQATSGADKIIEDFDKNSYAPFLRKVSTAIRKKSPDKLLFLDNSYYSNLGIPYSAPPIEIDGKRDPQQVFGPHAYDFMVDTPTYKFASDNRVKGMFDEHKKSQDRLNMPVIVGEWGGFGGDGDDTWLKHIVFLLNLFDSNKWSNTYWQYMSSFFDSPLMRVFIRPYPQAVTGEIESYNYDYDNKIFTLTFDSNADGESVICAPFSIKSLTVDGAECEYQSATANVKIKTEAGKHTVKVQF